ncbi:MAG: sugar phosphate isomerase/epimerase family protein [Candidatus Methanofastidiosia archaeon]|jgi:sugar phosphate isomerase/epimerase
MIGVSSLCMLHDNLHTVLQTVNPYFSHIEVICEGYHTDLEVLHSYDMTVSFHAPFSDLNIGSLNPSILKESITQISSYIEKASTYNVHTVCIHPGHYSPLGLHFKEKVHTTRTASLKKLARTAEEYGVVLGVENMPQFSILYSRTPDEIKEILQDVSSPFVKFTFDLGHANIVGDVYQFLELIEDMVSVHVHDNCGDHDTHIAFGEGTIPVNIVNNLKDLLLIIEVNTFEDAVKSFDTLENIIR